MGSIQMTDPDKLVRALLLEDPAAAKKLGHAGKKSRDAQKLLLEGDAPDERLPDKMVAQLRIKELEEPEQRRRTAKLGAKRAANVVARELEGAPTAEQIAKMKAYHEERMAQNDAPPSAIDAPNANNVTLAELDMEDIHKERLARRKLNEKLQREAEKEVKAAKKKWVKDPGGKDKQWVGFTGRGREEAARDEPMQPKPDKDAAALAEFRRLVESGEAPWLDPSKPFDPLEGYISPRERLKDERAALRAARLDGSGHSEQGGDRVNRDSQPPAVRRR
jgi:hypothetical protein